MKLTKGKISKLYKIKKQSLKRKNKNKKSKHHTFRKHKKLNLARKTLKKYRGGADESATIQIVDKPFNSRSGTITNTNYIVNPDGKLIIEPNATPNANAAPNANAGPNTTPNTNATPNSKPKRFSFFGSKSSKNSEKSSDNTNTSSVSNQEPSKNLSPRETTVMVVDQLYKQVHDNDKQNSSEALKGFVNEMAKPMPAIENGENAEPTSIENGQTKPPENTNVPLLTNS